MEPTVNLARYHGLVMHLARQAHQRVSKTSGIIDLEDLIQEGMVGLVQAARAYAPDAGTQFSTFAYPRIAGAIRDALRRLDPLSQDLRHRVREMETARSCLAQGAGKEPKDCELAEWLKVSTAEVDHLVYLSQVSQRQVGLGASLEQLGLKMEADQEWELNKRLLGEEVRLGLGLLDPIERQVLVLRFCAGLALKKVGAAIEKPLHTVYKIEMRARLKMKVWLEAREWEVADILGGLEEIEGRGG